MNKVNPSPATPSALAGDRFRGKLAAGTTVPAIGIYDAFSASLAARSFDTLFCSGYGFSASYYGLPDEGFITWADMVHYVERLRHILPDTHLIVDIDDGYGDAASATNVVKRLDRIGASAVIFEDQKRPKKCGHLPGKEISDLDDYLTRLKAVLAARNHLFVVARTDAENFEEGLKRARAFADAGADAVMVEGLTDIQMVRLVRKAAGDAYVVVNLLQGGKTPPVSLPELSELGANIVVYSTPCLFPAQQAIEDALANLTRAEGRLHPDATRVRLATNNAVLKDNAARSR